MALCPTCVLKVLFFIHKFNCFGSMYEKNQLASRFAAYEDTIKGHVSKLQSDYEALVQMIQHEDKAPDQLHELKIPSIDTFAVSVVKNVVVNLCSDSESVCTQFWGV